MPRVTVTTDDPKSGKVILLEESIELIHLESQLASRQLLERVRWGAQSTPMRSYGARGAPPPDPGGRAAKRNDRPDPRPAPL